MITLFLKNSDIPELTAFSGNIDADSLKPHIYIAQTTDIKRVLGIDLYTKIYNDFVNNTLSGVYKTIFDDYVVDMLVYFACSKYMAFGATKTTNGGVFKQGADGATVADFKEVAILKNDYKQLAAGVENNFYEYMKTVDIEEYKNVTKVKTNLLNWY